MKSYEELIKLKEMLDSGVITQEEFTALKKRALEEDDISLQEETPKAESVVANSQVEVAAAPTQQTSSVQTVEIPATPVYTQAPGQTVFKDIDVAQLDADLEKWGKISIATLILGLLWGVIALFASSSGKKALAAGDYETATKKLKLEKIMLYVAIGCNVLYLLIMFMV